MAKKLSKKSVTLLKKATASKNRRVARDNKKFEAMSSSEKRVQIARDVLGQLLAKRLIATPGLWLEGQNETDLFDDEDLDKNPELQSVLKNTKECTGCALGGMFMCAIERADNLKLGNLSKAAQRHKSIQTEDVFKYMKKFFSIDQLELIESAFEQGEGHVDESENDASQWLSEVDEASERMRLIMENIVANKGKFTLGREPVMTWTTPGYTG